MTQKMVDGEYLSRLINGSFEEAIRKADEMVENNAELFGGGDGVMLQSWTFPKHVLVVNSDGEFFRASFGVNEDTGESVFSEVERVDVPVKEARELSKDARANADAAVKAILSGDKDKAEEAIGVLHTLVQAGVSLTAESVEDQLGHMDISESEWFDTIRQNEKQIRAFVGSEGNKPTPQPRYSNIEEMRSSDDHLFRRTVRNSLTILRNNLTEMCNSMALAREIGENHTLVAPKTDDDPSMSTQDFMEFVEAFDGDLCMVKGSIEDAIMVSEDGDVRSLARIHDSVAGLMYEMNLAAVFCEKLARRFTVPAA